MLSRRRLIERLPERDRRGALDGLSEMRLKRRLRPQPCQRWKELSIDLAQHIAARLKSAIGRSDANCVRATTSKTQCLDAKSVPIVRQLAYATRAKIAAAAFIVPPGEPTLQ